MAQARKKPVPAKAAAGKPASLHAAKTENQTEAPDATIRRLACDLEESKERSYLWMKENERLTKEMETLKAALSSIGVLVKATTGELMPPDSAIPF